MPSRLSYDQEWGLRTIAETPASYVIGIDEVGLGACAGPLVVAGAVFHKGWAHPEIKDSKSFSGGGRTAHDKRVQVFKTAIHPNCLFSTIDLVPHHDIDSLGMAWALEDAIRRVAIICTQSFPDSVLVIDGDNFPRIHSTRRVLAIPKGDTLVTAVSAASIIAKTTRDALMFTEAEIYPGYGFENHVGYFTQEHSDALERLGPCPIHRLSYKPVQRAIFGRTVVV